MTSKEIFAEFSSQILEKEQSLNRYDCPPGYAFEEYQEGWRAAFRWAVDILANITEDHENRN